MVILHRPPAPVAPRIRAWRGGRRGSLATPTAIFQPLAALGLLCAAVAVLMRLVAPGLLDRSAIAIGVVGILIGVPHGSVDHLVPFWATGRRITLKGLARVLAGYLAIAALAIGALVVAPTATFVVFLAASALHFGWAEVEFVAERRGPLSARSPGIDRLRAAAHGLTVVVLPLALWPDRVHDLLTPLAPALAGHGAGIVFDALAVIALGSDLALLVADAAGNRRQEAAETVLLVLLMATVPPLPAFAVYFGAWHAVRHTARLLALPGPGGVVLSARAATRRYLVHALPPTLVVLVALIVVVGAGSRSVFTSALLVLVALTFPHMRTVADLDRLRHSRRAADSAADPA